MLQAPTGSIWRGRVLRLRAIREFRCSPEWAYFRGVEYGPVTITRMRIREITSESLSQLIAEAALGLLAQYGPLLLGSRQCPLRLGPQRTNVLRYAS